MEIKCASASLHMARCWFQTGFSVSKENSIWTLPSFVRSRKRFQSMAATCAVRSAITASSHSGSGRVERQIGVTA
jgi:hypothetical protein